MKYFFIIFTALSLFSCSSKEVDTQHLSIEVDSEHIIKASDFFDTIEYLYLDIDQNYVGSIRKIIISDDKFYIWDDLTKAIHVFHKNGKALQTHFLKGEGPNKSLFLTDFEIVQNEIYVLNEFEGVVKVFSENGNLSREYDLREYPLGKISFHDGYFYLYADNPKTRELDKTLYNLHIFDQDFNHVASYLPTDMRLKSIGEFGFFSVNVSNQVFITKPNMDSVYIFDQGIYQDFISIDYGSKSFSSAQYVEFMLENSNSLQVIMNHKAAFGARDFFDLGNYYYFNFIDVVVKNGAFYHKKNGSHVNFFQIEEDIHGGYLYPPVFSAEGYLYSVIDNEKLKSYISFLEKNREDYLKKGYQIDQLLIEMKSYYNKYENAGNPILVKMKPKEGMFE